MAWTAADFISVSIKLADEATGAFAQRGSAAGSNTSLGTRTLWLGSDEDVARDYRPTVGMEQGDIGGLVPLVRDNSSIHGVAQRNGRPVLFVSRAEHFLVLHQGSQISLSASWLGT